MNYKSFEKAMEKAHCRVEKNMGEKDEKSISIFARTKNEEDEVKIFHANASDEKQSFDDMAKQVHIMFLQAGVKLTLLSIAEARGIDGDEKPKSKLVDMSGNPLS